MKGGETKFITEERREREPWTACESGPTQASQTGSGTPESGGEAKTRTDKQNQVEWEGHEAPDALQRPTA